MDVEEARFRIQFTVRKGRKPRTTKVYESNGPRECARRYRQMLAGQLKFMDVKVTPLRPGMWESKEFRGLRA